jgi:hypothetical protein
VVSNVTPAAKKNREFYKKYDFSFFWGRKREGSRREEGRKRGGRGREEGGKREGRGREEGGKREGKWREKEFFLRGY